MAAPSPRRFPRWARWGLGLYLVALAASRAVDALAVRTRPHAPDVTVVRVPVVDGEREGDGEVEVACRVRRPAAPLATVLLLHGNPGRKEHFAAVADELARRFEVVSVDLPGFGDSTRDVPDYSARAHARYVLHLLDALDIPAVHAVGFSMGGAVGLQLGALAPERVRSLTMLSSIGVEELELFGSHELNHAIHALQLALVQGARWLLPHFGYLDRQPFLPYARNFYDTDQRPLRGLLETWEPPLLVIHGPDDFLVPIAAAREHWRIVPQSELALLPGSHFLLWTRAHEVAQLITDFVEGVEAGRVPDRAHADPERVTAAAKPFDPAVIPPFEGPTLLAAAVLLALATLVSEDLACIGAGLLVAQGRMGFLAATLACFAGILLGDVMLYVLGRLVGRPAVERAPLRWLVTPAAVERASAWLARRGSKVVFLSRFVPGLRLPTYVTAGVLRMPFGTFGLYFVLACLLWTPLLVGLATWLGDRAANVLAAFGRHAPWAVAGLAVWILLLERVALPAFTHGGRRRLLGRLRRWRRWEFWPPWVFYAPVALYVAWLALRHRGFARVSAVNPAIPTGGFIGESKGRILDALARGPAADGRLARHLVLPAELSPRERTDRADAFLAQHGLGFPVVLKPDAGQRGAGVRIVRDAIAARAALTASPHALLAQEHVPGAEYGIFWVHTPGAERGRIFAITEKAFPEVVGDGRRTLEQLILDDPRAVAMHRHYVELQGDRAKGIPAHGERVRLVELGTHCLGAIFLDGARLRTDALERAVDAVSLRYAGFHFGRYDVRAADEEALRRGNFKILELNGVTSEATGIYDPRNNVIAAWRTLFRQWALAFEIGSANRRAGAEVASLRSLLRDLRAYRRRSRSY